MAPTELDISDIAVIVSKAEEAYKSCRGADLGGLAPTLKSTAALVERFRQTLSPRFDSVPPTERQAIRPVLRGLEATILEVLHVLDEHQREQSLDTQANEKRDNVRAPPSFGMFDSPATAAAIISMWRTAFNFWAFTVLRQVPRTEQPFNDLLNGDLVPDEKHPAIQSSKTVKTTEDVLQSWLRDTGDKTIKARAVYRYTQKINVPGHEGDDVMQLDIRLSKGKITGTSTDAAGSAEVEGAVNAEARTIKISKKYGIWNSWARWEYNGHFTPWGISGVWHSPSGPNSFMSKLGSGRFILWLDDELIL